MRPLIFLLALAGLGNQVSAQNLQKLTFATSDQPWAPFLTWDENKEPTGLVPDILNIIIKDKLEMDPVITALPWARAQMEVKEGMSDFTITLKTPDRLEWAVSSDKPLYSIYFKVYTYPSHPRLAEILKIKTLEDVKRLGLMTVSNLGNNWHKTNVEATGISTYYVKDDTSILNFLMAHRADIAIDSPLSLGPRISKMGIGQNILETPVKFEEVWFYVLFSKKSRFFDRWPSINRAITETVSSKAYRDLYDKTFAPYFNN